ncbi:MAG TPA: hypothetical protein VKV57_01370 [bacterium]|nr:hypothetical protein [bacterium]
MILVLAVILIPALGLAGVGQSQAQTLQVSPVPIWGLVLGTIIVAGLLYLVVHSPDGGYYRYPYYGEYYHHYYRPQYRPYTGFYPASAPVIIVAPTIVGVVLGVVVVNHLEYVLTRDAYGHLYRYPYYGPYRQVYYRPTYRPYTRTFQDAPVREGDRHWDTDKRNLAPVYQRPQRQPTPAYQQPQGHPNPGQNGDRGNSGGSRHPQEKCGHPQEQPCSNNTQHQ